MAASVLSGILKVDKDTKKAFLSIDATLQKMYKLEADKNKREIKQRKEDQQQQKIREKEGNVLEDILKELKKKDKAGKNKKDEKSLIETLLEASGTAISGFFGKLFAVGGQVFAVVAAAIGGWKIGELINKLIDDKVKPFITDRSRDLRGLIDKLGGGGSATTASGRTLNTADLQKFREEKRAQRNGTAGAPTGIDAALLGAGRALPGAAGAAVTLITGAQALGTAVGGRALSPAAAKQFDKDDEALGKLIASSKEYVKLNNEIAKLKEESKKTENPEKLQKLLDKITKLVEKQTTVKTTLDEIIKSRPGLDQQLPIQKKQRGGSITVPGYGSGDKVPMMLPPGSFVMNRNASAMLQSGGLVPTLLEPGEKVFGPNEVSPLHHMLNTMIPRFQEGGMVATNSEGARDKATNKGPTKSINKGVYIEGGWGPSGPNAYGAHYHIHKSDRSNFGRTGLDQWVTVDGERLSSGLTVPGGQYGAPRSYGGHQGIDFAFGGGVRELSLKNGAEWIASQKSSYGDKTAFKTPNGVYELLHGTFKGNALPMTSDGGQMASSSDGGEPKPQNALDMLMGTASGLGVVGKAITGMIGELGKIAGSELMNALFGIGPANAAGSPQPTTGAGGSGGGNFVSAGPGKWKPVLDIIARAESIGGSYDTVYGGVHSGLSKMTLKDADAFQVQHARRTGSAASGRYQFMNILAQGKAAGIKPDDIFSPANQDLMATALIEKKRGVSIDMARNNPSAALNKLAMEWAGLPTSSGKSHYAGDGRNAATVSKEDVLKAFTRLQTGGVVNMSSSQSPNTARFKQAQEEFAQMIAEKTGSPIIIMGGAGGGQQGPTVVQTPNAQSPVPNLPSGPDNLLAARNQYWNLAMSEVC